MGYNALGWASSQKEYLKNDKLVLLTIAGYADNETGRFFHGRNRIVEDTGLSLSTVKAALLKFKTDDLLISENRFRDDGSQTSNNYTLNLKKLKSLIKTPINERGACVDPQGAPENLGGVTEKPGGGYVSPPVNQSFNQSNNLNNNSNELLPVDSDKSKSDDKQKINEDIREVFEFWKTTMNKPRCKLDTKRRNAIARSLKNYSVAELKSAVIGCSKIPHNMGFNDRNQKFNDIELICRDATKTDRFIESAEKPKLTITPAAGANNHASNSHTGKPSARDIAKQKELEYEQSLRDRAERLETSGEAPGGNVSIMEPANPDVREFVQEPVRESWGGGVSSVVRLFG